MIAGRMNIMSRRGETHDATLILKVDGVPVDLTGYSGILQVRTDNSESAELVLTLSTDNGRIVMGDDGTIRRTVDAETLAAVAVGTYSYDLAIQSPDGTIDYVVEGPWVHKPRISILAEA